MSKIIIFLSCTVLLLGGAVFVFFKLWRKNKKLYKNEYERAERLRYQLELEQNQKQIMSEVFNETEKKNNATNGLTGRDKYNVINNGMRKHKN